MKPSRPTSFFRRVLAAAERGQTVLAGGTPVASVSCDHFQLIRWNLALIQNSLELHEETFLLSLLLVN